MKRLLLVTYVFPPEPSPGSQRPGLLAKYLPEFGWEATVLTHTRDPAPFACRTVHADGLFMRAIDRLPYRARNALCFPDATAAWTPTAVAAGARTLRTGYFDAIFGTALPASVHAVCAALSKRFALPWLADYRDPWNGNAYRTPGALRARLEHSFERRLLARAAAITAISDDVASTVGRALCRDDVVTIPNAYDPQEWEAIPRHASPAFNLCYTGSLYDGKRSPQLLFESLVRLRKLGDPAGGAHVHFYGPNSNFVPRLAARFGLSAQVHMHGTVPRAAAMHAQRSAAATLIFLSMTNANASEMGSKYLEYAGARRPMLAFGPKGNALEGFLRKHELGWFAADDVAAEDAVRRAYAFWKTGADMRVPDGAIPTSRDLARSFAQHFDRLCEREQCDGDRLQRSGTRLLGATSRP